MNPEQQYGGGVAIFVILVAIASTIWCGYRLVAVPTIPFEVGPDLVIRSSVNDKDGAEFLIGDRLLSVSGQSIADLRDMKSILSATASDTVSFQVVRPIHSFTVTLDEQIDPTKLPNGVTSTDKLVSVDGRALPGDVGPAGVRSILSRRPNAVLAFERSDAIFTGEFKLSRSIVRWMFILPFVFAILMCFLLARGSHRRVEPAEVASIGFETVCVMWSTLLLFKYQWVIGDLLFSTIVCVALGLVRPASAFARTIATEEDTGAKVRVVLPMAIVISISVALIWFQGIGWTERSLLAVATFAAIFVIYELVQAAIGSNRGAFDDRKPYIIGIVSLCFLAGAGAYFVDPVPFLTQRWTWFVVVVFGLLWFSDVVYIIRGPSASGLAVLATDSDRRSAIYSYLTPLAESHPNLRLHLAVLSERKTVLFTPVAGSTKSEVAEKRLHDAITILTEEQVQIPMADPNSAVSHPMTGIAQTMQIAAAAEIAPPSTAISDESLRVVFLGFFKEKAGELKAYVSTEFLDEARLQMTDAAWSAALFTTGLELALNDKDAEHAALRSELARKEATIGKLQAEIETKETSLTDLAAEKSEFTRTANTISNQLRVFHIPNIEVAKTCVEAELLEGLSYLLEAEEPIVIGGSRGTGKRFTAYLASYLDEQFDGQVAYLDAVDSLDILGEMNSLDEELVAAISARGTLIIANAQLVSEATIDQLLRMSKNTFRLYLLYLDEMAQERTVLHSLTERVQSVLAEREIVLPNYAVRHTIHDPVSAYFLKRSVREQRREAVAFSSELLQQMDSYVFPGNVAELRFRVLHAVQGTTGEMIEPDAFWSV